MAGAASVLEDQSTLSRLDRSLFRLESVFALVSGLAVFALMVMAVVLDSRVHYNNFDFYYHGAACVRHMASLFEVV